MSILNAENLGLSFGAFDLFRGITVSIANDAKIGLIGPNGIGKTSLLLILAGINSPTTGIVHVARNRRMGYLRQEAMDAFSDRSNTVYEEMQTVFVELQQQQERLHSMEVQMASGEYTDAFLEEYGSLQHAFELAGGYEYDLRIQQTLAGLGLGKEDWKLPLNHLSGGQKTRALLARLLLEKPDLLILDEPTNHLDIEAVEWLERILNEWQGAVLIVSHDRYFLDNTVNTIWEMSLSGVETYSGNYTAYLLQRQERWDYLERVFSEEKTRLVNEADFIQRNWVRASTHARALGLLKKLSRELSIVENFGILALRSGKSWMEMKLNADRPLDVIEAIRKVNGLQLPGQRPAHIRPRIGSDNVSGNVIVRARQVLVGYPGKPLFTIQDLELRRGECASMIGPNGAGKTTFLKSMLGKLDPLSGEVQLGSSLEIGYFAQAHDDLDPTHTVLEELTRHKEMDLEQAHSHLALYLFKGDDIYKMVSALSGGERARLALAILALEGANFLMLDEPTNHLDIPAQEALQEMLENYTGTILLVSHDRFLINRLATQIWELRDGKLIIFKGNYREFVLRRAAFSSNAAPAPIIRQTKPLLRDNSKETKQRALDLARLEERIHTVEADVKRFYRDLQKASDKGQFDSVHDLSWKAAKAQSELEELMVQWEKLAA